MKILGLERVALEVPNMTQAIDFFSDLLGTRFIQKNSPFHEETRLAFSELGIELYQEQAAAEEVKVRSFHLRVQGIEEIRHMIELKGGEIVTPIFEVGNMKHLIAKIWNLRVAFVEYEGDDAIAALDPGTFRKK